MTAFTAATGDMWELLHAALGLQQRAARLVSDGQVDDAGLYEREALVLLGDATHLLRPEEPAQALIKLLTVSGLTRLSDQARAGTERQSGCAADQRPGRVAAGGGRASGSTAISQGLIDRPQLFKRA